MKVCKQCVLNSNLVGVEINSDGLCNSCVTYAENKRFNKLFSKHLENKMLEVFESAKSNRNTYDALVLFSGGKDSTYLLNISKNKYNLNTLAFSVIHPLVNEVAAKNMEKTANKLNVDLIKFHVDENIYKQIMKYGLINGPTYGLTEFAGCELCSSLFKWLAVKMAIKLNIPVVLEGSDASQSDVAYFVDGDVMKEDLKNGKKPFGVTHDIFHDALGEKYRKSMYSCDYDELKDSRFPTFIAPFTFIEYDYVEKSKEFKDLGLESKHYKSLFTNCDAVPFFSYFSIMRYDCVSYIRHFANEIRRGYPNLMQLGLQDTEKSETLTKQVIEDLMTEFKNIVLFAVDKKLYSEDRNTPYKEQILSMAPTFHRVYGEQVCDILLNHILMINYYADYFDIDLRSIDYNCLQKA